MVNVDSVYQKVLVLSNKEQRGYVTPQEFNLLADKAQMEIINDYFHSAKVANLRPGNQSEASDDLDMVREKMNYLRSFVDLVITNDDLDDSKSVLSISQGGTEATNRYNLATLSISPNQDAAFTGGVTPYTEITETKGHDIKTIILNPLTRPTLSRPVYHASNGTFGNNTTIWNTNIDIFPQLPQGTKIRVDYWRKPKQPNWGYVIVNQKPLYNFNTSINFELHPAEEERLVMRILQLMGIAVQKPELVQTVMVDNQTTKQNQNT